MSLVDTPMLRESIETDATDLELQRLIDDADEAIVARFGPHEGDENNTGQLTEELYSEGGLYLFPNRQIDTIGSVTEYGQAPFENPDVGIALETSDYQIIHGGRTLERLVTGANPMDYWGPRVVVEYVPIGQLARRKRVALDLCKLALTYKGLIKTEQAGDYRSGGAMTPDAYQAERNALLSELQPAGGLTFA